MTRTELQKEISRLLHSGIARSSDTIQAMAILSVLQMAMSEGTEDKLFRVVMDFTRQRMPLDGQMQPEDILEREA